MKDAINAALRAVKDGRETQALSIVEALLGDRSPDDVDYQADDLEQVASAIQRNMEHPSYVIQDWLILARDRLRGHGIVPATLALQTCLNVLEPETPMR